MDKRASIAQCQEMKGNKNRCTLNVHLIALTKEHILRQARVERRIPKYCKLERQNINTTIYYLNTRATKVSICYKYSDSSIEQ